MRFTQCICNKQFCFRYCHFFGGLIFPVGLRMGKRKQQAEGEEQSHIGLGLGSVSGSDFISTSYSAGTSSISRNAVECSNIGFQLLKKCGWKEGTGLGAAEQGRLHPIETHVKHDKRGIGAEKKLKPVISSTPKENDQKQPKTTRKKKILSKKLRKLQAEEKRMQEQEFERAFYREFLPDNV